MGQVIENNRARARQRISKFAAVVVIAVLAATGLTVIEPAAPASAAVIGDDYPANLGNAAQDALVDPWNFYNRECTSFVAWRLNNTNGVDNFTNQYLGDNLWWGNANTWGTSARAKGIRVDNIPAVGSVAWSTAGKYGHVAWVAEVLSDGKIVVEEYNWGFNSKGEKGRYRARTVDASTWTGFIHVKDLNAWPPSDGSFVRVADTGEVYRIAGGAPVYVSSWAPFGGTQHTQSVTATKLATLRTVPEDGTHIRGQSSGDVYTIAHGAPVHVQSWAGVGGEKAVVGVDDAAIDKAGQAGVWRFLKARPADGFLRGTVSGRIFRVVGGRPYYVASWDPYGGGQPFVNVDDASIDSCDHMNCTPWGGFDSVTGNRGTVSVRGWAQDPNTLSPLVVNIYLDGKKLGSTTASGARADIEKKYHRGNGTAFKKTLTASPGAHEICVYAVNVGVGKDAKLGCKPVNVAPLLAFSTAPTPKISGLPRVDETLSASNIGWSPSASVKYQWKANGAAITGATDASIKLTDAQVGKTITVSTTASASGRVTTSRSSSATSAVIALRAFTSAPIPTVSGTAKVGMSLTAKSGTWNPKPSVLEISWARNGSVIAGATSATYKLTPADMGATITATMRGQLAGYNSTTKVSMPTTKVLGQKLSATPSPVVIGTASVGNTLRVGELTWAPAPVNMSYQWKRDGIAIAGATKSAFTITVADVGSVLTVETTGAKAGFVPVKKSSVATARVSALVFASSSIPTVTGTNQVGKTLTATASGWSPQPDSFTYQWKRGGQTITGANKKIYVLTTGDVGATVSVVVTASRLGYVDVVRQSAAGEKVPLRVFTNTPMPVVSGQAKVGSLLTATAGVWQPSPTKLVFQWTRNGAPIPDATGRTYRPTSADAGAVVSMTVTASRTAWASVARKSLNATKVTR